MVLENWLGAKVELLDGDVELFVEGTAHQFVAMSMFGRVVGTEEGLQRDAVVVDMASVVLFVADFFGGSTWSCDAWAGSACSGEMKKAFSLKISWMD